MNPIATQSPHPASAPQIKVCGLTREEDIQTCLSLGVNALGFVFYPKSPRHVSKNRARDLCREIGQRADAVGVFVNAEYRAIMERADFCGLTAVQLHGQEPPDLVRKLLDRGLRVIKALFAHGEPGLNRLTDYYASASLVECGRGRLPGGNALTWNWSEARPIGRHAPLILAGGLAPENVAQAIESAMPAAVDVSSGVEEAPGIKDPLKLKPFVRAVSSCMASIPTDSRRIFHATS